MSPTLVLSLVVEVSILKGRTRSGWWSNGKNERGSEKGFAQRDVVGPCALGTMFWVAHRIYVEGAAAAVRERERPSSPLRRVWGRHSVEEFVRRGLGWAPGEEEDREKTCMKEVRRGAEFQRGPESALWSEGGASNNPHGRHS